MTSSAKIVVAHRSPWLPLAVVEPAIKRNESNRKCMSTKVAQYFNTAVEDQEKMCKFVTKAVQAFDSEEKNY